MFSIFLFIYILSIYPVVKLQFSTLPKYNGFGKECIQGCAVPFGLRYYNRLLTLRIKKKINLAVFWAVKLIYITEIEIFNTILFFFLSPEIRNGDYF